MFVHFRLAVLHEDLHSGRGGCRDQGQGLCALCAEVSTQRQSYIASDLPSLFEVKDGKNRLLSEEDASVQPNTLISKWHWEAARALADIPDLPLVVARPGLIYGKPVVNEFTGRLCVPRRGFTLR
jgi:hypothetical protein